MSSGLSGGVAGSSRSGSRSAQAASRAAARRGSPRPSIQPGFRDGLAAGLQHEPQLAQRFRAGIDLEADPHQLALRIGPEPDIVDRALARRDGGADGRDQGRRRPACRR